MDFIVFTIFILIVVGLFLLSRPKLDERKALQRLPYFKISTLLSPAELSFYHVLKIAVLDQYDINTKVRLADVISIHNEISRAEWHKAFNKIKSKHLDFVLTDKETSEIICAIELDDASHTRKSRQIRDAFLTDVLRISKLPFLRFAVSDAYQSRDIANKLSMLLEPQLQIKTETAQENDIKVFVTPDLVIPNFDHQTKRRCPKCGSHLMERKSSKGKSKGDLFLGCSNYPKCRYTAMN